MKVEDVLVAWVSSILELERAKRPEALTRFEERLGESWSVRQLVAPGISSLGARLRDGRELPLAGWIEGFGEAGPLEVRVLDLGIQAPEGLPEHIAAAFAHTQALALAIRARGVSSVYVLDLVRGRSTLISPEQLMEVARLQPHAARVIEAWAQVITESNELNGRPPVEASQVERFLCSPEGTELLDLLGGDLMHALQSTVRREGGMENIPEAYRRFFRTLDPDDLDRDMLGPDRQHEFIPSEERLSLELETTPQEFVALVDAQPFAGEIWERIAQDFNKFLAEDEEPYTAESLKAKFVNAGPEYLRELPVGNLTREWQGCCRGHGVEPIIPPALRERVKVLGPTPEERERDKGIILERERLRLMPNTERSETYLFREVEGAPPLLDSPARPVAELREEFLGELREAEAFAQQAESPFFEAFKLARFVLESTATRLAGKRSQERVDTHQEALKAAGFSEQALAAFDRNIGILADFDPFHPSEQKLRALLACELADVFGGMGSWNDQYFETPEAQERHEQLSGRLFRALSAFRMAALNAE